MASRKRENGVDLGFRIIRVAHVRIPCRRLSDLFDPLKISLDGGLVHPGEYNTICLALGRGIFTIQMRQFHRCTPARETLPFSVFLFMLVAPGREKGGKSGELLGRQGDYYNRWIRDENEPCQQAS